MTIGADTNNDPAEGAGQSLICGDVGDEGGGTIAFPGGFLAHEESSGETRRSHEG